MNIEQHEHRVQGIINATCERLLVRVATTVATDDDGCIQLHNTYDCTSKVHAKRALWVFIFAISFMLYGVSMGAFCFTNYALGLPAMIVAGAMIVPITAATVRKMYLDPISAEDLDRAIANDLATAGYRIRVVNGSSQVTWE